MTQELARDYNEGTDELTAINYMFNAGSPHVTEALSIIDDDSDSWVTGCDDDGNPWAVAGFARYTLTIFRSAEKWLAHVDDHTEEKEHMVAVATPGEIPPALRSLIQ